MALLADIPSTGHLGNARAQRFSLDGDDLATQTGEFLDFAFHHVNQGRKVVALYPRWRSGRAERAIRFARGALRTDHIAAVPLDVSPLALSLLADQLAYLAPYLPSGLTAELGDTLAAHVLAGGWLRSVANLSTIPITVKQHMGSFAPGVVFLAFCAPVKRVGRVKKANPEQNIPFRPLNPTQILVSAGRDADRTAFEQQFLPVIGATAVHEMPEQPLGPTYWGTTKYVEFVVFSAHQDALTHAVRTLRSTACGWCRERVVALLPILRRGQPDPGATATAAPHAHMRPQTPPPAPAGPRIPGPPLRPVAPPRPRDRPPRPDRAPYWTEPAGPPGNHRPPSPLRTADSPVPRLTSRVPSGAVTRLRPLLPSCPHRLARTRNGAS